MLRKINTILYATDLSNTSSYAFRYAVCLARALDARIHILHAIEPLSQEAKLTLTLFMQNADAREEAISRRRQSAEFMLAERQDRFWAEMPADEQRLRDRISGMEIIEAFAAEAILRRAETLPADLILMGSHAHGISHTFLGTVAKRVLRRARIPTLIVPYSEA